jgi:hypothetical protein
MPARGLVACLGLRALRDPHQLEVRLGRNPYRWSSSLGDRVARELLHAAGRVVSRPFRGLRATLVERGG